MNPLVRIVDANANRAREALRVMEDAARFGLDDAELGAAIKRLRHALRDALEGLGLSRGVLVLSRDTAGDVGIGITTPQEMRRGALRDVATAAAARLTEALRSIEESVKGLDLDSRPIAALRYRAYECERLLLLALGSGRTRQWSLCVIITEALCLHHPWEDVVRRALDGGADCIQLREKTLPSREFLARAHRLVEIVAGRAAAIINDRADIALLCNADGVHVGQEDLPVEAVRRLAEREFLVGVSTSTVDEARQAVRAGADYCGIGAMFPTPTKERPALVGPPAVERYLADPILAACPHLAIGGITPENVGEVRSAGARGIAVSVAVCSAKDPAAACAALKG